MLVGVLLGVGATVLIWQVGLPWQGGSTLSPEDAASAYSPSADFVSQCESVGKIQTTNFGKQSAYVCGVVGTDGYKGPVCFIRRSDGQVLEYSRNGTCVATGP